METIKVKSFNNRITIKKNQISTFVSLKKREISDPISNSSFFVSSATETLADDAYKVSRDNPCASVNSRVSKLIYFFITAALDAVLFHSRSAIMHMT